MAVSVLVTIVPQLTGVCLNTSFESVRRGGVGESLPICPAFSCASLSFSVVSCCVLRVRTWLESHHRPVSSH